MRKAFIPFVASLLLHSCATVPVYGAVVAAAPHTFVSQPRHTPFEESHQRSFQRSLDSCFRGCHEGRKQAEKASQKRQELSAPSKAVYKLLIWTLGDPSEQ